MAEVTAACSASDIRDGVRVDSRACGPLLHVTPGPAPYVPMPVIPAKEER